MDFEYYGISKNVRDKLIAERNDYFIDYWRDGRHFSRHKSKDKGSSSRILDKNIYENLLRSFYLSGSHYEYQGVFNGYRQNEFIDIHLQNKYILIIDFKNCYRNITFEHFVTAISKRMPSLEAPLPMNLVRAVYFPGGHLQAGLSASNIICDLVLRYNFDKPINTAIHQGSTTLAQYSRYYDDLYISSNSNELLQDIYAKVKQISKESCLPLNYEKSKLRKTDGSKILGSRISDGAIRISRNEKNNLRATIHELENTSDDNKNYEHRLRSVIYRLSRICRSEAEVNSKYSDQLDHYRDALDTFSENYDQNEIIELRPINQRGA